MTVVGLNDRGSAADPDIQTVASLSIQSHRLQRLSSPHLRDRDVLTFLLSQILCSERHGRALRGIRRLYELGDPCHLGSGQEESA